MLKTPKAMSVVWVGPAKVAREARVAQAGQAVAKCVCADGYNAAIAKLLGRP